MKKLIGLLAFITIGLSAYTKDAPPPSGEPAQVATVEENDLAAAAGCPASTPKCCAMIGTRCLECVRANQQCP